MAAPYTSPPSFVDFHFLEFILYSCVVFSNRVSSSSSEKAIKLCKNNQEREMYENYAELYSIIKTVEYLEKAYVRDSCSADE